MQVHVSMSIEKQQEAHEDEDEAVAGVSHAEGEEQQEEDRDVRRRVEPVVLGASIHIRKHGEHPGEPIAFQLDGRVVLKFRFRFVPECVHAVEGLGEALVLLHGGEALKEGDVAFDRGFRTLAGQVHVQVGQELRALPFNLRNLLLESEDVPLDLEEFILILLDLLLGEGVVSAGGGDLLDRETVVRIVGNGHEPHLVVLFVDDLERSDFLPAFVEDLLRDAVPAGLVAAPFQFVEVGLVELAPGLAEEILLPGRFQLETHVLQTVLEQGGLLRGVFSRHRERGDVREILAAQEGHGVLEAFSLEQQLVRGIVHGLEGPGDVHDAQFLQSCEELFFFTSEEDEVVAGHFLNHACSSSSSAACLLLTILEEALERFSSSSMYRLILRMASL